MALGVFGGLTVLGALDPTPLRTTMRGQDPTDTAFQALIAAVITGVTLIISIAQLSVSQELAAAGSQRERMTSSLALQEDIEDAADSIGDPSPATYLRLLCEASRRQATALEKAVAENSDTTLRKRVGRFVNRVSENADGIEGELADAEFGEFDVIRAALNYNYSWKIYATRRLRIDHANSLSEKENDAFDRMSDVLQLFGPAQEYFKTHYIQWEFVNLSRAIMYVSAPALTVAVAMLLYVDAGVFPGEVLGIDNMTWVVSAAATFTALPFFIFISYMLRIATISKRTGATGPFILRDSERLDVFDW
ncbi:hypothetical protein C447_12657 [Halococcus hamelinensis 100A6]|uniref:Uncharacterized protein n=2 Tax=Halococcus hamelinensis TaxID=332168 RepID=M0LVU6_9EURY|nr:hypothetical protein C447_12657 [Halococcus hamelinensis 100A6]